MVTADFAITDRQRDSVAQVFLDKYRTPYTPPALPAMTTAPLYWFDETQINGTDKELTSLSNASGRTPACPVASNATPGMLKTGTVGLKTNQKYLELTGTDAYYLNDLANG